MILQELVRFYDRKLEEGEVPSKGYSAEAINFIIKIDLDGNAVCAPIDKSFTRVEGKKKINIIPLMIVPEIPDRSSDIKSGFIVDKAQYVLGYLNPKKNLKHALAYEEKISQCQEDCLDEGIRSLLKFLQNLKDEKKEQINLILGTIDLDDDPLIGFEIEADYKPLWERENIKNWYQGFVEKQCAEDNKGQCLISGQPNQDIVSIHKKIKGGSLLSPHARLVVFGADSWNSYNKNSALNAPISLESESKYIKALKYLNGKESKRKLTMGEIVLSFWTEDQSDFEETFKESLDPPFVIEEDENLEPEIELKKTKEQKRKKETENINKAKQPFEALEKGIDIRSKLETYKTNTSENSKKFFALGLQSPNPARLSVRFWYQGSIYETAERIAEYFNDLEIVSDGRKDKSFALWKLLASTAFENKSSNVHPKLAGDMVRAILQGTEYPRILLQALINRIRAERSINYSKAALLKAFLTRWRRRLGNNAYPEIKIQMDESNTNTAYRLGRLFATLEKLQEEAHENKLNATIRDRFYGSASANPAVTFPILLKLSNHHLEKYSKLETSHKKRNFEKLIGEIIDGIDPNMGFPNTFTLEEQGLFAIGYYQQKQAFYAKKEANTNPDDSQGEE